MLSLSTQLENPCKSDEEIKELEIFLKNFIENHKVEIRNWFIE